MTEKSHVGLMQEQCVICLEIEDTGVLIDRRLRKSLDHKNVVGFLEDHCKACQSKLEDGKRVALVVIDEEKSKAAEIRERRADAPWSPSAGFHTYNSVITGYKPELVVRTGDIAFLTRTAWERIFDVPPPKTDMVFAPQEVLDRLTKDMNPEEVPHGEIYQGAESAERDAKDAEPGELPPPDSGRDAGAEDEQRPEGGANTG